MLNEGVFIDHKRYARVKHWIAHQNAEFGKDVEKPFL